jgi:uncharacterized protein YdaL
VRGIAAVYHALRHPNDSKAEALRTLAGQLNSNGDRANLVTWSTNQLGMLVPSFRASAS